MGQLVRDHLRSMLRSGLLPELRNVVEEVGANVDSSLPADVGVRLGQAVAELEQAPVWFLTRTKVICPFDADPTDTIRVSTLEIWCLTAVFGSPKKRMKIPPWTFFQADRMASVSPPSISASGVRLKMMSSAASAAALTHFKPNPMIPLAGQVQERPHQYL